MAFLKWLINLFGGSVESQSGTRPVLIFELGQLQVYSFQTIKQIEEKAPHTKVYWQTKASANTYGPFPSVYDAMKHYTWILASQGNTEDKTIAPVIYVDFNRKARIDYK